MAKKQVRLTSSEKEKLKELAKFASELNEEDLGKPGTLPSPIAVGDLQVIEYKKLDKRTIEKYLLLHPVVPRGIEIKANRIIRRGYNINGGNQSAREYCQKILVDSGGLPSIRNWIKDAYGFGAGYRVLVPNKAQTEILYLSPIHPIYFGIARYPKNFPMKELINKQKIDPKTKKAAFYSQWIEKEGQWQQFGLPLEANKVAHLKFDTWGDEPEGISLVQYVHYVITYLLNIEDAGAKNMFRHGQTQKKLKTNIKSDNKMKELAKNVANMNSKDVIILPDGSDVENLIPGQTQFVDYHDVFLTLIAVRLGIPKPLLTMDGTSTNKATLTEQTKDIIADYYADELIIEQTIEDEIFKPACKLKYGDDFKEIPNFKFNVIEEEKDKIASRMFQIAQSTQMFSTAMKQLSELGDTETERLLAETFTDYINTLRVYPEDQGEAIVVKK